MYILILVCFLATTRGGPATDSLKDQHCTDPRTMRKHAAYTEWADAYSCTRHRCQPGGRNLAIYTVGCKRVEAPESAIECEEVVEDTNMQFPYCCTRLRCLVVVRGEVWTRVLGQPWETLPAAPWSHMYKMKKPPPVDGGFLPKEDVAGPIYELAEPEAAQHDKNLRSKKDPKECSDAVPRSVMQTPDIVIALSTGNEGKKGKSTDLGGGKYNRARKETSKDKYEEEVGDQHNEIEAEEAPVITEKIPEVASEERFFANTYPATKSPRQHKESLVSWTEIPQDQWNEHEKTSELDSVPKNDAPVFHQTDPVSEEKKEDKPSNFQALVDAIGTRMRDIETVVQKMSEKVRPGKEENSGERKLLGDHKDRTQDSDSNGKLKAPSPDTDQYKRDDKKFRPPHAIIIAYGDKSKRFVHTRGSKYLHPIDSTTEPPVFVEDTNLNGYFSDASNNMVRRANGPKEPAATYMAPVNTGSRRNSNPHIPTDTEDDSKHKKHTHKKKKNKRNHKKHHKEEKKRFNKINSIEIERNVVSLEDSGVNNK